MTDTSPNAADLFDKATLLALFPKVLPADCPPSMSSGMTTMLSECIDAANKAGEAGVTPLLAKVVLETMSLICTQAAMWLVNDYEAAIADRPPTAPVVATPPAPAPTPAPAPVSTDANVIVYPGAPTMTRLVHGNALSGPNGFMFNESGDAVTADNLPMLQYPFTIGCFWRPSENVSGPGTLIRLDTDTASGAVALFVQNNGSVQAQARTPYAIGTATMEGVVDYDNFVLSAAVFVSSTERYVYSSAHGLFVGDTTPIDFTGSAVDLTLGSDGDHQFVGMVRFPFVLAHAMTLETLDVLAANPATVATLS